METLWTVMLWINSWGLLNLIATLLHVRWHRLRANKLDRVFAAGNFALFVFLLGNFVLMKINA